ncbi:MAG: hypothetical protein RSD29_04520 [Bacilli bacterium]
MKKKKIIIAILAIGTVVLLGSSLIFKGDSIDKNSPKIIQEGKKLAKGKDVEEYVGNAFEMFKKHGPISSEVWQEYDLSDKIIIIGERDNKTDDLIRGWSLTTTDKKELTKDEINKIEFPSSGGYNKVNFENKDGITLSINEKIVPIFSLMDFNYIYEVAVHEMYHFYFDDMTKYDEISKNSNGNSDRYTAFPKDTMPRVYRKMIYDNIVLAYENPLDQDLYLGKAKYWNEKWQNEYPQEYNQSKIVDIAEGKARYIEYLMCIDYKDILIEEKTEAIKSIFNKNLDVLDGIDSESYELGFASGVVLDRINSNWKKEIDENPQRPVELLLKDVQVVKDDSDYFDKVLKKASYQIKKSNKKIEKKIKSIEEAENNNNIPIFQLNGDFMNGSYTTSDFIEYKGKVVVLDFGATFKNNNGIAKIDKLSSYLLKEQDGIYNLPLTMNYKFENNRLVIDEKGISVDAKVKQTNNNGRIIYTME